MPTELELQIEALQAELVVVRAAVIKAYSGSEYEIASGNSRRRLKRQDIGVLTKRQAELELAIGRLTGCGTRGISHGVVVDGNSPLNT